MAKRKPVKRRMSPSSASNAPSEQSALNDDSQKSAAEKVHSDHDPDNAADTSQRYPTSNTGDRFPIVGVGASAGGLKALQTFLAAIPENSGLAVVIVQHLDPTRKSLASEVLSKSTTMQVAQVVDDPYVRPNHVYVIPPAKYLSISNGELHLSEPEEPRGRRMAVDHFLRSLAQDQQHFSVGIILSGCGSDGTLGVKAIKAAGGMVIAQDLTSADFNSMPRSAVDSGMVDHILPPEKMPEVLMRYAQHPYVRQSLATTHGEVATDADEVDEDGVPSGFTAILSLLRDHTRLDFGSYKLRTLLRRTRRRMCLHHLDVYEQYLNYLQNHPDEIDSLANDLLITVTDFFRDPPAWEALLKLAIRPLIERKSNRDSIRVWVAGCATGEEPYSMAMLILEELKNAGKTCAVNVFASDVDQDSIQFARDGRYPNNIRADVSPERIERFFTSSANDNYFFVSKALRETVVFAEQDLVTDPPFSRLDLVCCRNLLIYLKPEVQERVIAMFHFALNEGGVLFLGSAETVGRHEDLFTTLDKRWRIFRRVGATRHDRVRIPVSEIARRDQDPSRRVTSRNRELRVTHLAQQRLLDLLSPPAILIDRNWQILYISGNVDPWLTHKSGPPTDDLLDKVRFGLRSRLRAAVHTALSEKRTVVFQSRVPESSKSEPFTVLIRLVHDHELNEDLVLVMFQADAHHADTPSEQQDSARKPSVLIRPTAPPDSPPVTPPENLTPESSDVGEMKPIEELDDHAVIRQLEEELIDLRDDLQNTIEQLETSSEEYRASHEEVLSVNEELQSTNEELRTSKEELQSLNEELSTVNNQLANKLEELEVKHADLENLLTATDVATICLDTELCVRWFTPTAQTAVRLKESDKGRPLADLAHDFIDHGLSQTVQEVLRRLSPIEDEATCRDGRVFLRRVTLYRADDHRIGGVVITLVDITARQQAEAELRQAKELSENIVDIVHQATLVLNSDLEVVSANKSFYRNFLASPEETMGRSIFQLGDGQWDIPELRKLLYQVLPENQLIHGFEVNHDFQTIGRRAMLLNAQQLKSQQRILLAIEDITAHRLAAQRRSFLLEITDALHNIKALPEMLEQVSTRLAGFLNCDRVTFLELLMEQDRVRFVGQYVKNGDRDQQDGKLSDYSPDLLSPLLKNEDLIVHDTHSDERVRGPSNSDAYGQLQARAFVCIPRWRDDRSLAVLAAGFSDPHQWLPEEVALVRDVAERTWAAVDAFKAQQALRESEDRLSQAAAAAHFGSYQLDFQTRYAQWSPELYAIFGLPDGVPVNMERVEATIHPEDLEAFRQQVADAIRSPEKDYHIEMRILKPDGEQRWLSDRGRITFEEVDGQLRLLRATGMVIDVTERRTAEEELRKLNRSLEEQVQERVQLLGILQDAAIVSNEARTVQDAINGVLKRICDYNHWMLGHCYRSLDQGRSVTPWGDWYVNPGLLDMTPELIQELQRLSVGRDVVPGQGILGTVIETGQAYWIDDVQEFADWQRGDPSSLGLRAAIAFPVHVDGQIVAILECFSNQPMHREPRFMDIMNNVGIQLGHVISRKQLEHRVADAAEREQRRIGGDIHDGVGQELIGLRYLVQTHAEALARRDIPEAGMAERISEGLSTVQQGIRAAVRDLIPVEVDEKGLQYALTSLAQRVISAHAAQCTFECQSAVSVQDNLLATHLYRIAQEAVCNALQHSAGQHIFIRLAEQAETLILEVLDDGTGIGDAPLRTAGLGLRSMKSRADLIGAQLEIEPQSSGGTKLRCTLPLRNA